ncbi:MAG: ABC transporter ATP-binding protein [Ruminococcaceae bacterium]|nr:ABC transporter ATP-binding protein [Oscillospiraceae bacterium]
MFKLARYVKRYGAMFILGVILLFGQAIMELNLPNMMSNIVNVGIQNGGIEEVAPKAISPLSFAELNYFMTESDFVRAQAAYTLYSELDADTQAKTLKTFPDAEAQNALVLTATGDAKDEADTVMGRAGYALANYMMAAAEQAGAPVTDATETTADIDMQQIHQMLPLLISMTPQAALDEVIAKAAATDAIMTDATAAVLNKAYYKELGADTDAIQTNYILHIGIIMVLLSLATVACAVTAGFCFARLGAGVARDLRRDVFAKVSGFSNTEMDKFSTASLITRTTNDVTQVQMMYTMAMRFMVFAPIMGVGGIVMALQKSTSMSWLIAAAVGILLVVFVIMILAVLPKFKVIQKLVDRLNLVSRENLGGIMVVRAFSNQAFQEKRFEKANADLTRNNLFVGRAMVLMFPIMMLVMNGLSLFIVWMGADQIAQSAIQVGDMMAFIQYAMQVVMAFLFIAMVFVMVPRASVLADRIDEVLRSESVIRDPENPQTLGGRAKGEIVFNNVSFKYAGADEDVLHDISFTAKPGQTTAFIGSTGSGKSTLISLIPRFYNVTSGSVTLDGVDVRALSQHELRANIGFIPQKGLLFSGTIESNLRYGDANASDETLRRAAEVAQATEFIDASDDGFETEISQGGTNVSGGQRQRLSIARALVKQAPVYIFDDSFSALDFATDARLRAALKPYTGGATVLIVAQRVSTIMTAEQIVVLDEGRIAGIGTHAELLKTCPPYREIAQSQLSEEELA